jgi:hypothetical protein
MHPTFLPNYVPENLWPAFGIVGQLAAQNKRRSRLMQQLAADKAALKQLISRKT